MRRVLIAGAFVLIAGGAAAAGWRLLHPHDPLAEARQYMAAGNARAAELVLRAALQSNPSLAEAHFRLGEVQLRLGNPIAAERELRSARDHGWDAGAVLPPLAQAVAAQHRDAELLRDFSPDGLPPERAAVVLIARAQAQRDQHQLQDAAASIAAAMQLAPASVDARLAAARLALADSDRKTAERRVDEALAIDPHRLDALLLRAQMQVYDGDRTAALASYGAALDQAGAGAPSAVPTIRLARAGLLFAMGKDTEARADLDVVLQAQPKQPLANFLLARLLVRAADWKAADAALLNVGPALEQLPNGDLTLAVVKLSLNEPEQAIDAAQRQVAHTPDNLAAIKLLARLHFAQKRPDLAAKVLAAAAGHLDAEALTLMGQAYAQGGQPAQAVQALRQASALVPDDAGLLTRLAALELRQGNAGAAADTLSRALDAEAAARTPPAEPPATTALTALEATPAAPGPAATPAAPAAKPGTPSQADTAAALVLAALQAGEIDRATVALDRLREAKADPARIALLVGLVKAAQTDFTAARAAFEQASTLDPKYVEARLDLARVLALQGDAAGAIAGLQDVVARDPGNVAALGTLIRLYLTAGQKDQALAAAEAAHKRAPDNRQFTADLAALYLATAAPQRALDLLGGAGTPGAASAGGDQGGGQLDPALRPLRVRAELALGQRAAAATDLRAMLEQAPGNAQLRNELADVLAADKDYAGARALLMEGLARTPGDPPLLAALVALAGRESGPEAAVKRAEELARDPANPAAAVLKGDVLMAQSHFAEAAAAFRAQLASLPPDDPRTALLQIRAAQATVAAGKPEEAGAMLRVFVAAHPDSTAAGLVLSSFDLSAGRLPQARAMLETVLSKEQNNVAALNNLAWIHQHDGDLPGARALAARAYLLRPTPTTADTLGWIVLAQGDPTDALPLLREAAQDAHASPAILYHYAAALARAGQKEAAVTRLKALLGNAEVRFTEKPEAAKLLADLQS